ncbi:DUF5671 domain-containing protein [Poseidonocella sedimentorum]|uniref:DUF5671 domain-containing protein n=1 Tax=Poseidonocella sedimentorum TaxID=871652 RepID=A0A1I6DUM9_9RHOB|nr:DUF5671 domain-containing protein [Poseidonocella sedimentorum]SFR09145.1 hypothetical protein SAMN04515673_105187 [Poseidonocella sedimentorum]
MRPADRLVGFVGEALRAGRSRADIEAAMIGAGWSESEIRAALGAWAETGFTPPVPRPRTGPSPREAVIFGLMFVALVISTVSILRLGFELADARLGDPFAERGLGNWGIRRALAGLIVFFPLFLWLDRKVRRLTLADPASTRSPVRRWFAALTCFIAALALLTDLLFVIQGLLGGETALRFFAKATLVAAVAGAILLYYRSEMQSPDEAA